MSSQAGFCRDVLQEIVERIPLHKDILGYAAVCGQCRSIVMGNLHRLPHKLPLCYCLPQQHPLPLLMQCNDEEVSGKIEFLSVLDNKSFTDLSVPEVGGNWIAGSCNGWLLLVEILGEQKIKLLNPLTRAQIFLPSRSAFKPPKASIANSLNERNFSFVRKAIVISEPNTRNLDGCIVIAIISCLDVLSFCRPGDEKWTNIEGFQTFVNDVISYKGQLYAVIDDGALLSFDVEHQSVMLVAGHGMVDPADGRGYLVESTSGDLLLVVRMVGDSVRSTIDFSLYKLEEADETLVGVLRDGYKPLNRNESVNQAIKYQWVELESLDDQILFIGQNCSKSVPASLYPNLKGNCIYFTDDDHDCSHASFTKCKAGFKGYEDEDEEVNYDMGIYDMGEKSIRPIGSIDDIRFRLPPVWVEPNPW